MFDRIKSFFQGLGELLRNPSVIQDYRALCKTLDTYYHDAQSDVGRLQSELTFHKQMEAEGITVGKLYFDRQLDVQRMETFQKDLADPQIANPDWQRGFNTVTGFHTTASGINMIDMEHGSVPMPQFMQNVQRGYLVPAGAEQLNGVGIPASIPYLEDEMRRVGFTPQCLEGNSFSWGVQGSAQSISLDGWQAVEDLLEQLESGTVCGMLIYPHGEFLLFSDSKEYVREYKDELSCMGPMGVSAHTFGENPKVRKELDDLLYGEFGLENPSGLDHYMSRQPGPPSVAVPESDIDLEL